MPEQNPSPIFGRKGGRVKTYRVLTVDEQGRERELVVGLRDELEPGLAAFVLALHLGPAWRIVGFEQLERGQARPVRCQYCERNSEFVLVWLYCDSTHSSRHLCVKHGVPSRHLCVKHGMLGELNNWLYFTLEEYEVWKVQQS